MWAATVVGLLAAAGPAAAAGSTGSVQQYAYDSATGVVNFRVFTPSGYRPGHPVPIVVFVHGCNTTAVQQENASLYDPIAEKHDFIVMYPDDNDLFHPIKCWGFYDPLDQLRGEGDLATIVGMLHQTEAMRSIDTQRVYEIGMSSGALITSDLGAAYPDVFAAIGIMAGGPYGTDACIAGDGGIDAGDPTSEASEAFSQEGSRARVMPFIVLNGDDDTTVAPQCDNQAVQQWLRTDNLVIGGSQTSPLSLNPGSDIAEAPAVSGGHTYNLLRYTAPNGCLVGEHYVIHGMGHFWSGGTTDPTYAPFTDPKGPSASQASWSFFSRFTLGTSPLHCAPAPAKRQPAHRSKRRRRRARA